MTEEKCIFKYKILHSFLPEKWDSNERLFVGGIVELPKDICLYQAIKKEDIEKLQQRLYSLQQDQTKLWRKQQWMMNIDDDMKNIQSQI